jgi:hypothetical protein
MIAYRAVFSDHSTKPNAIAGLIKDDIATLHKHDSKNENRFGGIRDSKAERIL